MSIEQTYPSTPPQPPISVEQLLTSLQEMADRLQSETQRADSAEARADQKLRHAELWEK